MAEKQERQGNQSEGEFFALVATGTKSVENIFSAYRGKIMQRSAPNLRDDGAFDVWASRVLFEISTNDKLVPLLNTKKGVISAYGSITQAAIDGLQIGGNKPQAYFVPRGGEICLDIDARGYKYATVYGPGACLKKVPKLVKVYEGDDLRVDEAAGKIIYPKGEGVKMFGDGKLVGFACELEYLDGRREVKRVSLSKCREIEDRYGQKGSPMYSKSPEEADEKTAWKQLLKDPFAEAEDKAMRLALGGTTIPEIDERPRELNPDPVSRMGDRLDGAMRDVTPEPTEETKAEEGAAEEGAGENPDEF